MGKKLIGCIRDEMRDEYSNKGNYEVKFRKMDNNLIKELELNIIGAEKEKAETHLKLSTLLEEADKWEYK